MPVAGQIEFVNHASLLITLDDQLILTDPWAISPAFGTWTQAPGPLDQIIQKVNRHDPDKRTIVISHGHDDHLDELWLATDLRGSRIVVPNLPNRGLTRRVERVTGLPPIVIGEDGFTSGDVKFHCFQNPSFTDSDSVILIQTPEFNVVHANDNWHLLSHDLINSLNRKLAENLQAVSALFVQFGIADCFPICHEPFSDQERLNIIETRLAEFYRATEENFRLLECDLGFYYANQSSFKAPSSWTHASTYELSQRYLHGRKGNYVQLVPGMMITDTGAIELSSCSQPFLDAQLERLERFVNANLDETTPVRLRIDDQLDLTGPSVHGQTVESCVELVATRLIWSRILTGELTLETIIIGGAGIIIRPSQSITHVHRGLSKLSYVIQSKIRDHGLSAL